MLTRYQRGAFVDAPVVNDMRGVFRERISFCHARR